jgi:hypothetical protein
MAEPVITKSSFILNNQGDNLTITQQTIPSWNIAGRPQDAKEGTIGFNFETHHLEFWNGSVWLKLPMKKI